jgi:hypothetical protein
MSKVTYYVKKKIGDEYHTFAVEGDNFQEAILNSKELSFGDVHRCPFCQNTDLELSGHITEKGKHKYVYVRCKKCKATLNFGQRKGEDIFYLRTVDGQDGYKHYDWKPFDNNNNNNN